MGEHMAVRRAWMPSMTFLLTMKRVVPESTITPFSFRSNLEMPRDLPYMGQGEGEEERERKREQRRRGREEEREEGEQRFTRDIIDGEVLHLD